jgi:hypothetical protein
MPLINNHQLYLFPCAFFNAVLMFPDMHTKEVRELKGVDSALVGGLLGRVVMLPATMVSSKSSSYHVRTQDTVVEVDECNPNVLMMQHLQRTSSHYQVQLSGEDVGNSVEQYALSYNLYAYGEAAAKRAGLRRVVYVALWHVLIARTAAANSYEEIVHLVDDMCSCMSNRVCFRAAVWVAIRRQVLSPYCTMQELTEFWDRPDSRAQLDNKRIACLQGVSAADQAKQWILLRDYGQNRSLEEVARMMKGQLTLWGVKPVAMPKGSSHADQLHAMVFQRLYNQQELVVGQPTTGWSIEWFLELCLSLAERVEGDMKVLLDEANLVFWDMPAAGSRGFYGPSFRNDPTLRLSPAIMSVPCSSREVARYEAGNLELQQFRMGGGETPG